jgi:hypothetical protein
MTRSNFDFQAHAIAEPPTYTSRSATQYRAADWRSEILVPLLMAGVTGMLSLILALWLWWEFDWLPDWTPIAAFVLVSGGVWIWRLQKHDSMLTAAEEITRLDLNRDGMIGRPSIEPQEANITYTESTPGGLHMERDTLKISPAELAFIGQEVILEGRPFSKAIADGETITENRFRDIQAIMRDKGYARYKNPTAPKQGAELTKKGEATLRWYAENWQPTPLH